MILMETPKHITQSLAPFDHKAVVSDLCGISGDFLEITTEATVTVDAKDVLIQIRGNDAENTDTVGFVTPEPSTEHPQKTFHKVGTVLREGDYVEQLSATITRACMQACEQGVAVPASLVDGLDTVEPQL